MRSPHHERIPLRQSERVAFRHLIAQFGPEPIDPTRPPALGVAARIRLWALTHLATTALLLPAGLALMAGSILVWWPLGLIGLAPVAVGLRAIIEQVRVRRVRRRLSTPPANRRNRSC